MDQPLTEIERFPLLTAAGRAMLQRLREHPHAPRYSHECGDRLSAAGLERARAYERALFEERRGWQAGEVPAWLREFAAFCVREVPFYRRRGGSADDFCALPPVTRAELGREPWAFVPDAQPLDDLIVYNTSGTTGHPLDILCHPEAATLYLPLLRRALARRGVTLAGGAGRVAVVLVCAQQRTFTYATVSSYLDGAGFAKINLNPAQWRDPADRVRFLDDLDPEIYTGDPLSFWELAQLPLTTRPKALVSSAVTLLPALRERLEAHFGCPVLDVYSMNEAGPIALGTGTIGDAGHEILPGDLYVEILRPDGTTCPSGERGEIVLSGGRNPFLPLLRYRTGDWAALDFSGAMPVLIGLEGRPPTVFRATSGGALNNIDISNALRGLALPQFTLHQRADGSLRFEMGGDVPKATVRQVLLELFGPDQQLAIESLPDDGAKVIQYTSELDF